MSNVIERTEKHPLGLEDLAMLKGILEEDGLFVYPAGNLYGLGASIISEAAVRRVNALKSRPEGMGMSVMGTVEQVRGLCDVTPSGERFLVSRDLDVTVVLPASKGCPEHVARGGTLAVRLPPTRLCESVVSGLGPVTATSANIHGKRAPVTVPEARRQLGDAVALYIDGGRLDGVATTIVDLTEQHPKVLREGRLSEEEVLRRYGR